ncbi:thioesterase II family protein [Oerskovia jenensis]|uniref:Surfactin synthase thioesterase subunit n=1 Tax=Oerskovia jenensis TaxID=162169 RepID=A0ABS2LIC1_9CELL|nr:alpha/beta fold hydrolase [Oerskovia jenensis]MBM7480017.1 surfactin synthase thioesterase subunit [Oerskovia jenensis]
MTDAEGVVPRHDHPALRVLSSPPGATWRVVVCPHAGGAASYYRRLVLARDRAVGGHPRSPRGSSAPFASVPEVVAVQYPGRETRFVEPPVQSMADLLADVAGPVRSLLADDVPTVLLGHSLGASVAVRVAAGLGPGEGPDLLVVSGRAARADRPRSGGRDGDGSDVVGPGRLTARDDSALRAWITALGGTPPELLADAEFFALHARVLRADLAVHDSLATGAGEPVGITVPLLLLAGSDDVASPPEAVAPWVEHARAGVRRRVVQGGHFFVGDRAPEVVEALRVALTAVTAGTYADRVARPAAEERWVRSREIVAADLRRLAGAAAGAGS